MLETEGDYKNQYSAIPTDTGLLIHVGKIPPSSNRALQNESDQSSGTGQVTLIWNEVRGAASYNIYWSELPGVTKQNGKKITGIKNPTTTIKDLKPGTMYYFVVTTVVGNSESRESEELSFMLNGI